MEMPGPAGSAVEKMIRRKKTKPNNSLTRGFYIIVVILGFALTRYAPVLALRAPGMDVRTDGGALSARFDFHQRVEVKWFYVPGPERLVIDVAGALIMEKDIVFPADTAYVHRVRVAQFSENPDVVRIVFDLKEKTSLNVRTDTSKGIVTVSEPGAAVPPAPEPKPKPQPNPEPKPAPQPAPVPVPEPQPEPLPAPEPLPPVIEKYFPDIAIKTGDDFVEIVIPFSEKPEYTRGTLSNPPRLVFDFADYVPTNPKQFHPVRAGLVDSVRVSHYNNNPNVTRVVADLTAAARGEVSFDADGAMRIRIIGKPVVTDTPRSGALAGKIVCVDAGHGGRDPGALGTDGTSEKDINLDIALRLQDLLRNNGAMVIMTRSTDEYLTLQRRVDIANSSGAMVFVAIHSNALADHDKRLNIRGTQMYYYHKNDGFAATMQSELTAALGIGDAGTFERGFAVLRGTNMPAVLAEIAYLTHPDDLELLKNPAFRENAARGLYNGLLSHLGGRGQEIAALPLEIELQDRLPYMMFRYSRDQFPADMLLGNPPEHYEDIDESMDLPIGDIQIPLPK